MPDVFVSYSRRDGDFVRRLVEALAERDKDAWVDVEGIRDAEVFPERLRAEIEESDGFVFVISPDSVASPYCEQEVEHALALHKRIVPLLLRPVPDSDVPEGIRVRNWIPFAEAAEFEPGVARVVEALDTDLEWTKAHTRWLLKALEWDSEGREGSFLLRGSELAAAEAWLAQEAGKEPEPAGLQREYVAASRVATSRRQRRLLGLAAGVTAVSLGLLVFALISRGNAIAAGTTSRSQALAAESQTQLAIDPERSILLATEALREKATPEALFALRAALDASPIRYRLPDAPPQICGQQGFPAPGVAFSPDGRRLAEGLCGGTVVVADAHDGRVLRRLRVGTGTSGGPVAYSQDGRDLAACCRIGSAVLLDAATGAVRAVGPEPEGGTASIAFDPKAPVLALGSVGGEILLWNYDTHRTRTLFDTVQSGGEYEPVSLAFSPDGRRIAVGISYPTPDLPGLLLLDTRTGRTLASAGARTGVAAVVFSPDGSSVVASQLVPALGYGGRVGVFDATTLALRRTLVSEADVGPGGVAFSPDGTQVAYGFYDGTAGLVDARTGTQLLAYVGQTAAINQVAFDPDANLVATASADGTTRIWTTSSGAKLTIAAGGAIDDLHAFAGRLEGIVHRHGTVEVAGWTGAGAPDGAPLTISPTGNAGGVDFLSPDGRLAGVAPSPGSGPTSIWSVSRRRIAETVASAALSGGDTPDLSPDGSLIALTFPAVSAFAEDALAVVDIRTGRRRDLAGSACSWYAQPFSPDGQLVGAGDFCGRVGVWDVSTGKRVGRSFSIGGELSGIAFDPAGTRIAAASWNGTVAVADTRTGRVLGELTGDTSGVTSVVFSPNGRYIATASLDRTARVWDARTLRPLRVLSQELPVEGVRFTPDGSELVTWDKADTIRVWSACPDCEDGKALLALAARRVTRELTPQEKRTFGVG